MIDRGDPPKFEVYSLPEDKPAAKPNPFKIGDPVRLRDGKATNGIVSGILGSQVRIAWDDVPGDPQWYHQDFVATEQTPPERNRPPLSPKGAPENGPEAKPNPFKIGDCVRLRDGTLTNGTVKGILVDELLVAWDNVPGDPQWYHRDFISTEKVSPERSRASLPPDKPDAKPNPFKIGEYVRLRDGTLTNGIVRGILADQLLIEWDNVRGDPQWYHQDFIFTENKSVDLVPRGNQVEQDSVDDAIRLVARMDDDQRRRFIAYIRETYM
jgi:acyl dehydratase